MPRSSSVKEFTFGKKFVTFVTAYDFDSDNFSAFMLGLPGPVLNKVLDVFLSIVDAMSHSYINGLCKSEDLDVYVKAQRIQDAIQPFL